MKYFYGRRCRFSIICVPLHPVCKNGSITEEVQKGWRPGVNTSKVSQENKGNNA